MKTTQERLQLIRQTFFLSLLIGPLYLRQILLLNASFEEAGIQVINYLGGSFLMAQLSHTVLEKFFSSLQPFVPDLLTSDKYLLELRSYKDKYKDLVPQLSDRQIEQLTWHLEILEAAYLHISNNESFRFDNCKQAIDCIFMLLNNGRRALPVPNPIAINPMIIGLRDIIKDYPSRTQQEIEQKIFKPLVCSLITNTAPLNSSIYLLGPPGIGKTRLMAEAAQILNIPCIIIKCSNIYGENEWSFDSGVNFNSLHPYSRAMRAAKFANKPLAIVLLDELDKAFGLDGKKTDSQEDILKMFNSDMYYDEYINMTFKAENLFRVATGNRPLSEINAQLAAVEDRFLPLEIPPIRKTTKANILHKFVMDQLADADIPYTKQIAKEETALLEKDNNLGVRRLLLNANILTTNIKAKRVFSGTLWADDQNVTKPAYKKRRVIP